MQLGAFKHLKVETSKMEIEAQEMEFMVPTL